MTSRPSPLLQVGTRPARPAPPTRGAPPAGWATLPEPRPADRRPVTVSAGRTASVLVCSVRGTLYAYRDACPACGASLGAGPRSIVRCWPARVRRAATTCGWPGRAGRPGRHLDPLPLLSDSQGCGSPCPERWRRDGPSGLRRFVPGSPATPASSRRPLLAPEPTAEPPPATGASGARCARR